MLFRSKGFSALDDKSQAEVKEFIASCQDSEGAFTDRAGRPDLYYSLFGTWLSVALKLEYLLDKHKRFIFNSDGTYKNQVDYTASLLIKSSLLGDDFKKPSFLRLCKSMFLKDQQISIFYRLFLFVLVIDSLFQFKILYPAIRNILSLKAPRHNSPCSIYAAYTVVRSEIGCEVKEDQEKIFSFFEQGKGFKAFLDANEADLLSTAVALFALKTTGADFRNIAPDCLFMIQRNYNDGAFLAGNGDKVRDLEYTFYGLLALGTLT